MRVLLLEEDKPISKSIEYMLAGSSLSVYATDMGEESLDLAKLYEHDCILLDINLPGENGHEVLKQLRLSRIHTPTSAPAGMDRKKSNLKRFVSKGADYVAGKPVVARIDPIACRAERHSQSTITTGQIVVNLDARKVEVKGKTVHLTRKEYQILEILSMRKGATLTREVFLNHLYGDMRVPSRKILEVFIWKLRKKLSEATMGENYIQTVWGRGYVLLDPIERSKKKKSL